MPLTAPAMKPPSIRKSSAVMSYDASEAGNNTSCATSIASPLRASGVMPIMGRRWGEHRFGSVTISPGQMAFMPAPR